MATEQSTVTFKDIPGYPGYRVGDDGSVWSCLRRVGLVGRRGSQVLIGDTWRRMKCRSQGRLGYQVVSIYGYPHLVHRLVLEAFVGPCPAGMECCHSPDRSPTNNTLSNLRWGTKKANQADRIEHGTDGRGERHPMVKISEAIVRSLRAEYAGGGITYRQLGDKHNLTPTAVMYIIKRRRWKHVI